jgi:hypothetical protein
VGSTVGARLISSSRAGDELLFGYTTTSSPWLYNEQGASRTGHERVLGDRRNKRDASGRVLANFLSTLVPNMEQILYFMKSLCSISIKHVKSGTEPLVFTKLLNQTPHDLPLLCDEHSYHVGPHFHRLPLK